LPRGRDDPLPGDAVGKITKRYVPALVWDKVRAAPAADTYYFSVDGFRFLNQEVAMDTMWEKIKRGLRDGATLSIEKIDQYTKIGKLKLDEMAANRKIDRNFMDIGERVVDLIDSGKGSDVAQDLTIKKAMENIRALRDELADLAERIEQINTEARKTKTRPNFNEEEVSGV
jgi:hypothetical protein